MLSKSVIIALLALRAISIPLPQSGSGQSCQSSYDGTFGISIMNSTTSAQTTQQGDGQPNASGQVSQIGDGQTQVNQISDGQIQNQVNQISDGQVQNQAAPAASQISDGQVQANAAPVTQMGDGQTNSGTASTQMPDGQVNSGASTQMPDGQANSGTASTQMPDGQVNSGTASSQMPDGQVNSSGGSSSGSSGGSTGMVGCQQSDSLQITLKDGILTDSKGRTGYIAANFQFQFDSPPQAGTITASGFSVCDGALALNGKNTFYQCLSGTFYNLYDRIPDGRTDCQEVKMMVLKLVPC